MSNLICSEQYVVSGYTLKSKLTFSLILVWISLRTLDCNLSYVHLLHFQIGSHFNFRFLIVFLPILDHNIFSSLFAIHCISSSGKYYIFADRHKNVLCLYYHYIFDEINFWLLLSPKRLMIPKSAPKKETHFATIETWTNLVLRTKYFLLTPAPKRPINSRRWPWSKNRQINNHMVVFWLTVKI